MLPGISREDKVHEFDTLMGTLPESYHEGYKTRAYYERFLDLKLVLIEEEFKELKDEINSQLIRPYRGNPEYDWENTLKELADLQYVLSGLVNALGFRGVFEAAFNRVHQSNLSKLVDGKPLRRDDGKVLKGPNYQPPSMKGLVEHG